MFNWITLTIKATATMGLLALSTASAAFNVYNVTGNGQIAAPYSKVVLTGGKVAWYGRSLQGTDTSKIKVFTHVNGLTSALTGELPFNRPEGHGVLAGAEGKLVWLDATDSYINYGSLKYYNGSSISTLTNNGAFFSYISLSGNKVVWSQSYYKASASDAFLWDNGTSTRFPGNSNRYTDIDGDDVVYKTYNPYTSIAEITKYTNGNYSVISNSNSASYNTQISQGQIVWVESGRVKLYKNGVISTVSNDSNVLESSLSFDKGIIAWINGQHSGDAVIRAYNGSSIITLQDTGFRDLWSTNIQVKDGYIAWKYQDLDDNKWRVKVWENGQITELAQTVEYIPSISTENGQVSWIAGSQVYLANQNSFEVLPCAGSLNDHKRGISSMSCPYVNLRVGDKLFFVADGPNFAKTVIENNSWWAGFSWSEPEYQGASTSGTLGIIRTRNQGSTLSCPVVLSSDKRGMTSQGCPFVDVKVGDALYFVADGPEYAKTIVSANSWWAGFSWEANQTPYQGATTSGTVAVIRK